jgi:hypothetical protein
MTPCPGRSVEWIPTAFGVKFVMAQLHPTCEKCRNYVKNGTEMMPALKYGKCVNYKEKNEVPSLLR